jgi:quercetin dioxygenase-like cupin family protein
MALKHATSGEVINLLHAAPAAGFISQALVSVPRLEVMRLVLDAGKFVPRHAVAGPITIYCHQGSLEVQLDAGLQPMGANDLMYLDGDAGHALRALSDVIVMVTIFRPPASQAGADP